jgi:hypothetical protein
MDQRSGAWRAIIAGAVLFGIGWSTPACAETAPRLLSGTAAAVLRDGVIQLNDGRRLHRIALSHLSCSPAEREPLRRWLQNTVFRKPIVVRVISSGGDETRGEVVLGDGSIVNQEALRERLCTLDPNDPDPRGLYRLIHDQRTRSAPVR